MSGWNMPPGVSPSDIPGNCPEDDLETCPACEGYGAIAVRSFSRMDPPDSEECSVCEGTGSLTPEQILEYENKPTSFDADAAYDARFDR